MRRSLFLSVLLALLALPSLAFAAKEQHVTYAVYTGGFHVVQADLEITYPAKDRYSIFLGAKTYGFLWNLAPWEGTFESRGWRLKGEPPLRPELHKSVATWRGEPDIKEYRYTKAGGFIDLHVAEDENPPAKQEMDDELTQGTTDAFTAGLIVMEAVARGEPCEGSSEVFDGKRRFEQIFKDGGEEDLEPSRYNIYGGPTEKCTIEIKPVAGDWGKKPRGWLSIQEQGREKGTLPTVWLGTFSEDGPAVPVKILVKTAYGTLVMHAVKYEEK
jgi:hypothetical protein